MMRRWLSKGVWVAAGLVGGALIVYACTTDTAIGPDATLDSLYIEPANAIMVLDDTLHLTAVGVDKSGRLFANTRVKWVSHDATITLTSNGSAIALAVGGATVSAVAGRLTATAALTVQPKPAFATSRDSVAFTTIANAPDPARQSVIISNAGGGIFAPALDSIRYGPGATGWLAAALSGNAPDTLALDVLTTALSVGTYKATITLSSPGATNSPKMLTVTLAVGLGPPSVILADSGDGQATTVNTSVAIVPVARVVDQYANPLPGIAVTFAVTGGGGAANPTTAVTTDAAGRARVTSWTLGTAAGANTLRASGASLTPATFTATGVAQTDVSPTQSSVVASAIAITACSSGCSAGVTASTITVTTRDGFGNAIANAAVTVSGTGTNNVFSSSSGTTNASGVFTTTFNSTKAELKSISATADGGNGAVPISQTANVTVGAASPSSVAVTNSGFSARVGVGVGTLPTYTVRDQFSNPVTGFSVTYTPTNSGAFSGPTATNSSGQVTLTSWTMSGAATDDAFGRMANTVTVTAGTVSGSATDFGIYTYSGDVSPILGGCDGCHYINWTRVNIVGQPDQDPPGYTACSGYTLVTAGNANASLIYLKTAGTSVGGSPPCGSAMPSSAGLAAATRKILHAWINNGAPNN